MDLPNASASVNRARIDEWFVAEVLPLEPALMRLLRRHWRRSDEHGDLRQDIYVRVYQAALHDGPPDNVAAHVFTIARHLLIDRARRGRVVDIDTVADLEAFPTPGHDFSPERIAGGRGELRLLSAALDALPPRCREVIALRKIEGLSQRDIALRMGITEGTVEKQVTVGMRALAESLLSQGVELTDAWVRRWRKREPRP